MALPTAGVRLGGGATPFSDVYASAAQAQQYGVVLGGQYQLADGTCARLFSAGGPIALNAVVTPGADTADDYAVVATSAALQYVSGVNDRGSLALTAGQLAFMTSAGLAKPLCPASAAKGSFFASSTTAGTLKIATAGTDLQSNIYSLVANGGAIAATQCRLF